MKILSPLKLLLAKLQSNTKMPKISPGDMFQITKPTTCCNNPVGLGTIHIALKEMIHKATCSKCGKDIGSVEAVMFKSQGHIALVQTSRCIKFETEPENL